MPIEVPHQPAKQNPREGRRSDVAVRGDDALDVVNDGLDASWQLAGDCIHRQQGVALVRAVSVAQIDDGIQLLLQLRRKAGVAEGHAKGNASAMESGLKFQTCCRLPILYCDVGGRVDESVAIGWYIAGIEEGSAAGLFLNRKYEFQSEVFLSLKKHS